MNLKKALNKLLIEKLPQRAQNDFRLNDTFNLKIR